MSEVKHRIYTGEIVTNYGAHFDSYGAYAVGTEIVNRYGLKATIVGKPPIKYTQKFIIRFEDGLLGVTSYDGIKRSAFCHPINFSAGNNTTNKYKTIYKRWEQIKERCENPKSKSFDRYGARGIKCKLPTFYDLYFAIHKHERFNDLLDNPTLYDIDRIDNDGDYEASNITISTKSENLRNTRNNHVYNLIDNKTNTTIFSGIKIDCENWLKATYGIKTAIDTKTYKKQMGLKKGYSIRYERADKETSNGMV